MCPTCTGGEQGPCWARSCLLPVLMPGGCGKVSRVPLKPILSLGQPWLTFGSLPHNMPTRTGYPRGRRPRAGIAEQRWAQQEEVWGYHQASRWKGQPRPTPLQTKTVAVGLSLAVTGSRSSGRGGHSNQARTILVLPPHSAELPAHQSPGPDIQTLSEQASYMARSHSHPNHCPSPQAQSFPTKANKGIANQEVRKVSF